MKFRLATALALSLPITQIAAPAASAEERSSAFRTAAPQSFTTDELQAYGLSASDADQIAALQAQGYRVQVLTPEEARQYEAGMSTMWWIIAGVVVIAVVVAASN